MAPCGGNIVTPKMIRKGEIHIGDRIQMDETEASAATAAPAQTTAPSGREAVQTAAPAQNAKDADDEAIEVQTHTAPRMVPGTPMQNAQNMQGAQSMQGAQNMQSAQNIQSPQSMQGVTVDDNGVTRRQAPAPMSFGQPNPPQQQRPDFFPLNFSGMTDYANSLTSAAGQSPSFNVPSHPMVPPEYEQTIDYDSIQYMNGFLRTQIGRYIMVEQLIGSGNTEERFGFLVGMGNNYLLLQDISSGNILVIDFYSVKFVYIYYGEPVFPNVPFDPAMG